MFDHLYALGCSWTEGTDDEEKHQGWVGRLANKIDCSFTNLGGKGDSNWLQYYNFLQQPVKSNSICIWGLSSFTRIIGKNFQTIYAGDYDKSYLLKYHNDQALQYQTMVMLHSWQTYCKQHDIRNLLFVSFDDIQRIDKSYDINKQVYNLLDYTDIITETNMKDYIGGKNNISDDTLENMSMAKFFGRQGYKTSVNLKYFSRDGHPNANGYSVWADYLYKRLKNAS
jgi:hypothetical protein